MSLFNARFEQAAKDLANSDDEVLQSAGMMALMRIETLQRRIKGLNNSFNRGKALTPLPYMYPNQPNTFPSPWWQQSTGLLFGSNPQNVGFGAPQGSVFGSAQTATFGGSQPAGFGTNQSTGFGVTPSTGFGASASTAFGASPSTAFGANPSTGFGTNQSTGFGTGFSNANSIPGPTSLFGSSQPSLGAQSQTTSNATGNTAFSFGIPSKDSSDKSEEPTVTPEPAFFNSNSSVVPTTLSSEKS